MERAAVGNKLDGGTSEDSERVASCEIYCKGINSAGLPKIFRDWNCRLC